MYICCILSSYSIFSLLLLGPLADHGAAARHARCPVAAWGLNLDIGLARSGRFCTWMHMGSQLNKVERNSELRRIFSVRTSEAEAASHRPGRCKRRVLPTSSSGCEHEVQASVIQQVSIGPPTSCPNVSERKIMQSPSDGSLPRCSSAAARLSKTYILSCLVSLQSILSCSGKNP